MSNLGKGKLVPAKEILKCRAFVLGFNDIKSSKGYHYRYDDWGPNAQQSYERGRLFAILTKCKTPPTKGTNRVNRAAEPVLINLFQEGALF